MNVRDYTGKILEVKERNPFRHRHGSYDLESLKYMWSKASKGEGCTHPIFT